MLLLMLRPITPPLMYARSMVPAWCIITTLLNPLWSFYSFHLVVDFTSFYYKRCIAHLVDT